MDKNWGIDLVGRKMWYEPWLTDEKGKYREPSEKDIEEIYGISGEAVNESLLYLEECAEKELADKGGKEFACSELVRLLNEHIVGPKFKITREELLNKTRWYNNEYYFYFQMFCKKVIGRYDWRFGEGKDEQLSVWHRPYEQGFLKFIPWGKDEDGKLIKEQGGNYIAGGFELTLSLINSERKEIYKKELLMFIMSVLINERFKNVVSYDYLLKEFNWYSWEFFYIIYSFFQIFSNKDNIINNVAEYYLTVFPSSLVISLVKGASYMTPDYFLRKISNTANNVINPEILHSYKYGYKFRTSYNTQFKKKYNKFIYTKYGIKNHEIAYYGAFKFLPKMIYRLNKNADVIITKKNLYYDINDCSEFSVTWEDNKRFNFLFLIFPLLLSFSILFKFFPSSFYIIYFLLLLISFIFSFFIFQLKKKFNKNIELFNENLESFQNSRESFENITNELRLERDLLEQKVHERTTELAHANEQLKVIDKAKTNFFANISHELRTPLTLILGPIRSIITGNYGSTIKNKDSIFNFIENNGLRLLKLINNLLDFNKIEAGRMNLNKQPVDIIKSVHFFIISMQAAIDNKNIQLTFNCNNLKELIALVDKELIEIVISNLLLNAYKFTDKGGKIIIDINKDESNFILKVVDTGIGIPDDKKEKIFERFGQIDNSTNRKYEGTGIGLSLTKELIKLHEGNITVESKINEGSAFIVTIPIGDINNSKLNFDYTSMDNKTSKPELLADIYDSNEMLNGDKSDDKGKYKDKKTVLIVEDNKDMINYLYMLLGNSYNVFSAENGEKALIELDNSARPPDLIISDIMMPVMDGRLFFNKLQQNEKYNHIPLIFLTARADLDEKIEGLKAGAVDYISKPFYKDELLAKIDSLIISYENQKKGFKRKLMNALNEAEGKINTSEIDENKYNRYDLSKREIEIVKLIFKGRESKEIADELEISANTVNNHVQNIFKKTDVKNRIDLINKLKP